MGGMFIIEKSPKISGCVSISIREEIVNIFSQAIHFSILSNP